MTIQRRTILLAAAATPLGIALAPTSNAYAAATNKASLITAENTAGPAGATTVILDALAQRFSQLSPEIAHEAKRALLNWFGCALGAAQSEPVRRAASSAIEGKVPLYGSELRVSPLDASFLNCLSSAVYAFDDTHVPTIIHPTGPVAAALLALAQSGQKISGRRFLESLTAGIEIQCVMANAFIFHTVEPNHGLYLTGITGPVGAAAAVMMATGADREATRWAIGHAATQAAGLRDTHGAMSGMVVPAFAARNGLHAAQLAMAGFTSTDEVISGKRGLFAAYTPDADWQTAFSQLGAEFELKKVSYKPYPCGVVIHPILNTLRDAALPSFTSQQIKQVEVRVSERTRTLVDNHSPADIFPAIISAQHWVALALLGEPLGVGGLAQEQIDNKQVDALRHKIDLIGDKTLTVTDSVITITFADDSVQVLDGRAANSESISLNDEALVQKYLDQGRITLDEDRLQALLKLIFDIEKSEDFGADLTTIFS